MNFTPDERTPLRNQLAELEAAAQAAGHRAEVARRRQQGEAFRDAEDEVLAELHKFRDDADFKRRERGTPDEEDAALRAITDRISAAVKERGLVFAPTFNGRGLIIMDPSIDREAREARAESDDAGAAVRSFEREQRDAMREESEAAMSAPDAAMTTRDLPRVTRGG